MNTELFIARRIYFDKNQNRKISSPITTIAIIGIAVGLTIMIVSISVLTGFKNEISKQVVGFGSHINIINYDSNNSYETVPINSDQAFLKDLRLIPGVKNIQKYALKAGIIKTKTDIQGVVLKGIDSDFDWDFFSKSMIEGTILNIRDSFTSNNIIISKYLASRLKLKPGDDIAMYFVQDPPRMRKFSISGIYETGLKDFDEIFLLVDIKHIQKLNDWKNNQISGFEVVLNDFKSMDYVYGQTLDLTNNIYFEDGSKLMVINIRDKYPQIFDWLALLDKNVVIILILMIIVAAINMISSLLILILERTNMIGILKALGTTNYSIRKIFLYHSTFLIIKGLFWGNLFGLLICFAQKYLHLIKLEPTSYYLSTVPINLSLTPILLLNAGSIFIILLFLLVPSMIISGISPIKAIRFN